MDFLDPFAIRLGGRAKGRTQVLFDRTGTVETNQNHT